MSTPTPLSARDSAPSGRPPQPRSAPAAGRRRAPVPAGLKLLTTLLGLLTVLALGLSLLPPRPPLVEVPMEYPPPMFVTTPLPPLDWPNLEPLPTDSWFQPRAWLNDLADRFDLPLPAALQRRHPAAGPPPVMVPAGSDVNIALGRPVRSLCGAPIIGSLDMITDGDFRPYCTNVVEIGPEHTWIEIDLGAEHVIHGLHIFRHSLRLTDAYRATVIEIDSTPMPDGATVREGRRTGTILHNSDDLNALGFGRGRHLAYRETHHGRFFRVNGVRGRYVRIHSNGDNNDPLTRYHEVKVYGTPTR